MTVLNTSNESQVENSTYISSSLMDLLHPVKEVMMDGVSSLFRNQNVTDFKLSIPPTILEGSVKIKLKKLENFRFFGSSTPYQEIPLPGFGIAQDYINDVIESILNTITIWSYRDDSYNCGAKLLCA